MSQPSLLTRVVSLYTSASNLANYLQSPFLLAIRLYWGYQFAQSGWGKLHRIPQVTEFFGTLGIPHPHMTAILCSLVEFVGGILLALGLGSRLTALILFVNMSVAYWTADREAVGMIFSDPGKFYAADPFTFWFVALIVLAFGPGYLALDTLLRKALSREDLMA
jgi:putative oxidoreductase